MNGIVLRLPNLGLTCWLNSILQSLLNCNIFIKEISKESDRSPIIIAFKCIISGKYVTSGLKLLINILKNNIQIGTQQDALYGLICIVEELCNVKRDVIVKEEYSQYLKEWFKTSSDKVTDEKYKYSRYYTLFFSQLSFIAKDKDTRYDPVFTFNLIYNNTISDSLKDYLNTLRGVDTRNGINIISPILVFSINNTKDIKDFKYEERINLKDVMRFDYDVIYNFRSAIIHIGNERGGHYLTIILKSNRWILCDDINVREIDKEELVNYKPFILAYEF